MDKDPISPKLTLTEALLTYPSLQGILIKHRMSCIGCYMSQFCRLHDAARFYHLELNVFLREIEASTSLKDSKEQI